MLDVTTLLAQNDQGMMGMFANTMMQLVIIAVVWFVWGICLYTIAKKTGTPNEIWAWIPILNILLLLQIADLPMWYVILMLVPCVNLFVSIWAWWKVAEKRGKPGPVALVMLVPCIGIFVPFYIAFAD